MTRWRYKLAPENWLYNSMFKKLIGYKKKRRSDIKVVILVNSQEEYKDTVK